MTRNALYHSLVSGRHVMVLALALMVALASFAVAPRPVAGQMEYDFNGDGKVTCADFESEYPDTFSEEATKALDQYPDELSRLDGKKGSAGVACEGQPAQVSAGNDSPAAQTPEPAPMAETPVEPLTATGDVPAEVMARVEGCAVIAISARDVVGAGCPGVGAVAFRIPVDAPAMRDTVVITPRVAQTVEAAGTANAPAVKTASGSGQDEVKSAKPGKDKSAAKASKKTSDSTTTSKDTKKGSNDKNTKDKKKKGGKGAKKKDKKQRKH